MGHVLLNLDDYSLSKWSANGVISNLQLENPYLGGVLGVVAINH